MTHHPYDAIDHAVILNLRLGARVAERALLAHCTSGNSRAGHIKDALEYADELAEHAQTLRDAMARADAGEAAAKRARAMNAELPAALRAIFKSRGGNLMTDDQKIRDLESRLSAVVNNTCNTVGCDNCGLKFDEKHCSATDLQGRILDLVIGETP